MSLSQSCQIKLKFSSQRFHLKKLFVIVFSWVLLNTLKQMPSALPWVIDCKPIQFFQRNTWDSLFRELIQSAKAAENVRLGSSFSFPKKNRNQNSIHPTSDRSSFSCSPSQYHTRKNYFLENSVTGFVDFSLRRSSFLFRLKFLSSACMYAKQRKAPAVVRNSGLRAWICYIFFFGETRRSCGRRKPLQWCAGAIKKDEKVKWIPFWFFTHSNRWDGDGAR